MKKIFLCFMVCIFAISVFACSKENTKPTETDPPHNGEIAPFIGDWKVIGTTQIITFNKDGTITSHDAENPYDDGYLSIRKFFYTPHVERVVIRTVDGKGNVTTAFYSIQFSSDKTVMTMLPESKNAKKTVFSKVG
ncbi:MAG: hypothetical protein RRY79_04010 [Clostridia bacterium]